eukprot:scaffold440_cov277-Ochromonas_danica.AAC.4
MHELCVYKCTRLLTWRRNLVRGKESVGKVKDDGIAPPCKVNTLDNPIIVALQVEQFYCNDDDDDDDDDDDIDENDRHDDDDDDDDDEGKTKILGMEIDNDKVKIKQDNKIEEYMGAMGGLGRGGQNIKQGQWATSWLSVKLSLCCCWCECWPVSLSPSGLGYWCSCTG